MQGDEASGGALEEPLHVDTREVTVPGKLGRVSTRNRIKPVKTQAWESGW